MGVSGQLHASAVPYPGEWTIKQDAGWAPEPVWKQRIEEKSSASIRDQTPDVQSVVRHYTDWAAPAFIYEKGIDWTANFFEPNFPNTLQTEGKRYCQRQSEDVL
jgi:hypothetical protein